MAELLDYLKKARADGASDLYIVAGRPVSVKSGGGIAALDEEKLLPPRTMELISQLYAMAQRSMDGYLRGFRDEFTFSLHGVARCRVNAFRQRGSTAAVVRLVTFDLPDPEQLHIPGSVTELSVLRRGLALFTGGPGSGRSTTLACVVQQINCTRECSILTLEDPIEFLFQDEKCIVSQQEIGADAEDMLTGLRCGLRQSPDVVVLGSIPDLEVLRGVFSAAESGALILAVLPYKGAMRAVTRLLEMFPEDQRAQARLQLSHVLRAVVSQQLVPAVDGGMLPAFEQLTVNRWTAGLLRDGREAELADSLSTGRGEGLITMDQALFALYQAGRITLDAAVSAADEPEQMRRRCR